jgi:tetratricopeptide (TPR) repeat protein
VALGPERAEAWFALAVSRNAANDPYGAAAAAKAALVRSPNHVQAQETLAALLLEGGGIEEALIRCRSALAIDPTTTRAVMELARAHAFLGEWEVAADALRRLPPGHTGRAILWSRLRLWNPDFPPPAPFPEPPAGASLVQRVPFEAVRFLDAVHEGTSTDEQRRAIVQLGITPEAGRLLSARMQMAAEALSFMGRDDEAVDAIRTSVDLGLIDLLWMDRAAPMRRLAGRPDVAALRAVVAGRAARILAACR